MAQDTSEPSPFPRIEPTGLSHEVGRRIEELILSGQFKSGHQLPSTRELARAFGVGSTAVTQGLHLLAERGLVDIQRGKGAFVTQAVATTLSDTLRRLVVTQENGLDELTELRMAIEVEAAGFAAERATPDKLEAIRDACDRMDAFQEPSPEYIEADVAFHIAVADATGNSFMSLVAHLLREALFENITIFVQKVPGGKVLSIRNHRHILEAIARGDAAEARKHMREHVAFSNKNIAAIRSGNLERLEWFRATAMAAETGDSSRPQTPYAPGRQEAGSRTIGR